MIEAIKDTLWEVIQEKDVSLAMVFDREGRILWHRGRGIKGPNVSEGEGFPKSLIQETIGNAHEVLSQDVVVTSSGGDLPRSATVLFLRSLLIMPFDRRFFLYVDSGSKESFSQADLALFRAMGKLFGQTMARIRHGADTGGIVGSSPAMDRVRELVVSYALEEEPVLLLGETGAGKNHIAEFIHKASGRAGKMVIVHCPSIPESLFESELFGHARGAFTGATTARQGLVREAEGGTLLLDEVSDVPTTFQAKLLALAETGRYRVLGESRERMSSVRIIAASNRDLANEIASKRFRSDLFFRLNVLPIEIPPLRERPEDLRDLVEEHRPLLRGKATGGGFIEALESHSWPGNVRELIQVLKRAGIRLSGPTIGGEVEQVIGGIVDESGAASDAIIVEIETELAEGDTFWDTAWKRFLDRDINREQLTSILAKLYSTNGCSLRRLSEAVNIEPKEYPRFVSSLHKYSVHPGR